MLHGGGGGGGAIGGFGNFGPQNFPQIPNMGPDADRLREQLEHMERRLDEMQRRMHGPDNQPGNKPNVEEDDTK